ncbi:MAG: serine hydrolase [Pseudomonadota bacterium]
MASARTFGRWVLRAVLALAVIAAAGGLWYREEIGRLLVVNTLFDADRIVHNFSHMGDAFPTAPLPIGDAPATPLPDGPPLDLPAGVAAWLTETDATGIVVLDAGALVHQSTYLGTGDDDLRISWSIAKSFLSALTGLSVASGEIASLDDPVTAYVPRLDGTAYDGATVRNLLQMSTGVTFDEDYLDPKSDINRMGRILALGGSMDGFAASLSERDRPPGETWSYVSIDTHVLGMVLRGAAGRGLPELMSERLITPLGLEAEPYFLTDGDGVAFALGGLNLTLRDYARFGLMIAQDGRLGERQIVPADWIAESTNASAQTGPGALRYGYQWWLPAEPRPGEVMGRGVYGQYLYIDRVRDVVVVLTAANRRFREPGQTDRAIAMLRDLADAVVARR